MGYSNSNTSALLKRFLFRADELIHGSGAGFPAAGLGMDFS
jgi:hypothetical protein